MLLRAAHHHQVSHVAHFLGTFVGDDLKLLLISLFAPCGFILAYDPQPVSRFHLALLGSNRSDSKHGSVAALQG